MVGPLRGSDLECDRSNGFVFARIPPSFKRAAENGRSPKKGELRFSGSFWPNFVV